MMQSKSLSSETNPKRSQASSPGFGAHARELKQGWDKKMSNNAILVAMPHSSHSIIQQLLLYHATMEVGGTTYLVM